MISIILVVVGVALVLWGADRLTDGATALAQRMNVSQIVIGLTVVAMGTSLPELATSVVAARKGRSAMAMGNVIGSNVFNILMILGVTGMITPMQIEGITMTDMGVMLVGMVLMWMFSYTKYKVARWEGFVLAAMFVGYMAWLVSNI